METLVHKFAYRLHTVDNEDLQGTVPVSIGIFVGDVRKILPEKFCVRNVMRPLHFAHRIPENGLAAAVGVVVVEFFGQIAEKPSLHLLLIVHQCTQIVHSQISTLWCWVNVDDG